MAPIKKRSNIRARTQRLPKPTPTRAPEQADLESSTGAEAPFQDETDFSAFASSKKDRQRIKHSALLHRIEKSAPGKIKKRRRPNKKLVAGLEGLLGALPDVDDTRAVGGTEEDEWEVVSDEEVDDISALGKLGRLAKIRRKRSAVAPADGKMQLKTLKSRPGAMKRKARLEHAEMERFRKNMAQMQQGTAAEQSSSTADRWTALRGFIGQTMQQSQHFSSPTS